MTTLASVQTVGTHPLPSAATVRRIRFVREAAPGQEVLLQLTDPVPHKAVCAATLPIERYDGAACPDALDVATLGEQPKDHLGASEELLSWVAGAGGPTPVAITLHGAQVIWGPSRAAILAAPDRLEAFLHALVEFCYYERELQKLEREVADGWPQLEEDTPLAHDVGPRDADHFEEIARRMDQSLKRRIRLARIEPRLYQPRPHLTPLANQLIERLCDKANVEDRLETLDHQVEVFEEVYELNSQRIADFKATARDRTLAWVVIVLLAAEGVLLLVEILVLLGR